jgi:cytoskeleton protein RodZ
MDSQVGVILRRARNRRKVELSEVEAATRIRLRYLRAIESENWDVLPGGVYTRSFIRTYANFLGLDGERLAAEYRASVEGLPGEGAPAAAGREPPTAMPSGSSRGGRRVPALGLLAVVAVFLVAAAAIVLFPDDGGNGSVQRPPGQGASNLGGRDKSPPPRTPRAGVSVRLAASAEVWVCVLDARGRHLVDGQILETGAEEGPFRSGSFTVSFGNGEVSMLIDGKKADIPPTSSPVGYSIDAGGALVELDEAERPTCV